VYSPELGKYIRSKLNEGRIKIIIASFEGRGAALKDIKKGMKGLLVESNIVYRLNDMIAAGEIYRDKRRYFLSYLDAKTNAFIFGKRALIDIFVKNNRRMNLFDGRLSTGNTYQDFLLEFSNKIGAFITFCILQTLSPGNKIINSSTTEYVERDTVARIFIRNCLSHLFTFLLIKYRDAISNIVGFCPYILQKESSVLYGGKNEEKKYLQPGQENIIKKRVYLQQRQNAKMWIQKRNRELGPDNIQFRPEEYLSSMNIKHKANEIASEIIDKKKCDRKRELYTLNQSAADQMFKEFSKIYPELYKQLTREFANVVVSNAQHFLGVVLV
jgi:hypothetical protein